MTASAQHWDGEIHPAHRTYSFCRYFSSCTMAPCVAWECSGGRAHAECTLTPSRIPTKDRCTLSRSSLHWVAGDLGTSTPSAPAMGLLTSRMACVKRMQSCEQRPGTVKAQCGHWAEEREQHDLLPHFWVLHTRSPMPVPGIENSGLGIERPKVYI